MNYKVITCKTNKEFIELFKDYLSKYKIEMQLYFLNLTNSEMALDNNSVRGGVFKDENPSLIFLNAFPYNLQIRSLDNDITSFDKLAEYIIANNIDIRGIQGNLNDVKEFINSYNLIHNAVFRYVHAMDIMRLDELKEIDSSSITGTIIRPTLDNFDIVKDYINKMYTEALEESYDDEIIEARARSFINDGYTYLFKSNDNITSIVRFYPTPKGCMRISLVFTDKKYRGNGYAKKMLYLLINELKKEYECFTLFVDKKNPISNKLYKNLGFYVVEDNIDTRLISK